MKCKLLTNLKLRVSTSENSKNANKNTVCIKAFNRCDQTEEGFIFSINQWLSDMFIKEAKCEFCFHTGYTVLGHRSFLDSVIIKYKLSTKNNENQYAVAMLEYSDCTSLDDCVSQWKKENPDCLIIDSIDRAHSRSIFAPASSNKSESVQIYIFYEFDKSKETADALL